MQYLVTADTDVGIVKQTNQDSVLIKHANTQIGEIVLAVICDGMGGLAKGELASATVIQEFSRWFNEDLQQEFPAPNLQVIADKWVAMLRTLNAKIGTYGRALGASLGTTFTGMLFVGDNYLIGHVGDTRAYYINSGLYQLTTDQTFVAREIRRGTMTPEQAKVDKRRNMLLQCVGASDKVDPEVLIGRIEKGAYLLCSDGFRHEIQEKEIYESLNPINLFNKETMHANVRYLIEQNKMRQERDNISAVLIKAF